MDFEKLLLENQKILERFIYYHISSKEDAEDLIQETTLTAFQKFETLKNSEQFKYWILKIARNKCNDYYRKRLGTVDLHGYVFEECINSSTPEERFEFYEIVNKLNIKERKLLELYYIFGYSQNEIAEKLSIPIGTVKSRLYTAKQHFREKYPYKPNEKSKGDYIMKLPKTMPEYKIAKSDNKPFTVIWEELMGWLIVPKLGEKISWALYNFPKRNQTEYVEMEVVGKAYVHGIEGVEIISKQFSEITESNKYMERRFVAQLTDSHCRFLAESHKENDVTRFYTFLDDDAFNKNWGYGADNCGKETNLFPKGLIERTDDRIICKSKANTMDVIGRYTVTIANKEFDTVCVMDIESYDDGVVTEQYIDKHGKTVLWRRFNADDWKFSHYNEYWSNMLPDNEKIYVNDKIYVHWYDCISDYID